MIISRTPLRISFFGGGTDYPDYFERAPGAVLSTTIDKYVYISLNRLSDFFDYKIRVGYSKSELVNSVDDIVHPSVRESLKFKKIDGNLDIHIFADLPARTGLGSSSAFTVGFLNALYALEGHAVSSEKLASDAIFVEQQLIGENVGSQDQINAAYGGLNLIEFDASGFKVSPFIISGPKQRALDDSTLIFYTGQMRYADEILAEQVEHTKSQRNDSHLEKMYELVFEAVKIASNVSDNDFVKEFGQLLHESWRFKKSLSSKVSNSTIDQAYEAAVDAGAYGGKIAGAGGGGFLMFIVRPEAKQKVRDALASMLEVDFRFETHGSSVIYMR